MNGVSYYRSLTEMANNEWSSVKGKLHEGLRAAEKRLDESRKAFTEGFLTSS